MSVSMTDYQNDTILRRHIAVIRQPYATPSVVFFEERVKNLEAVILVTGKQWSFIMTSTLNLNKFILKNLKQAR